MIKYQYVAYGHFSDFPVKSIDLPGLTEENIKEIFNTQHATECHRVCGKSFDTIGDITGVYVDRLIFNWYIQPHE